MIEMLPPEYYPQLHDELKIWKSKQPQQNETRTDKHKRLLDNYHKANRELEMFHFNKENDEK